LFHATERIVYGKDINDSTPRVIAQIEIHRNDIWATSRFNLLLVETHGRARGTFHFARGAES